MRRECHYLTEPTVAMSALKPAYQVKHFILSDLRIFLLQSNGLHCDGSVLLGGDGGISDSRLWGWSRRRCDSVFKRNLRLGDASETLTRMLNNNYCALIASASFPSHTAPPAAL